MSQFNRLRHRHLQRQINKLREEGVGDERITKTLEDVYELLELVLESQEKQFKIITDKLVGLGNIGVAGEDFVSEPATQSKKRRRMTDTDVSLFIPDISVSKSKMRIKEDSIASTEAQDMKSSISSMDDILGGK